MICRNIINNQEFLQAREMFEHPVETWLASWTKILQNFMVYRNILEAAELRCSHEAKKHANRLPVVGNQEYIDGEVDSYKWWEPQRAEAQRIER